jgi:outer membrane protein
MIGGKAMAARAGSTLSAACLAAAAGAQVGTPPPAPPRVTQRPAPAELPAVPARPTAAAPLAVPPSPPAGPVYQPDRGGALSGLPRAADGEVANPAPTAPVGTLAEAITLAYRTNPQLLSARAQARATDYRIPQARSAYGPTLNATGAYTFTRTRTELQSGAFRPAQGWTSTASLVLNQPLLTFGRNAAAEAGAVALSDFQRSSLRVTEAQVLDGVVESYVAVLRDAQAVTIARQNLAILERQLSDNTRRFEVRDLTQTDLDQTRTRVEFGRAQLVQAEGQLGISQTRFLQFVGAPPGELQAPDLLDVRFGSLAAAYAYAETNSGLIRAAQARERVSRAQLESAKADSLPRVDLRGTAEYDAISPYTDRLRASQLTGQVVLTQPVIDSGLRRARIGEAREANQSDWRLLDTALRDTRQAIGAAWDQLAATRASLAGYREAIAAAERAYEGAVLQQRAGDRSTLDVLDLARDLLTVRTSYNTALADEYLARSSLLGAAGMLEGPLLVPGLAGYDAEAHRDRVRGRGDIPLLTPALSALDGLTSGDLRRDRPSRDAGAAQAVDATLPLPPPPAP